MFVYIVMFQDVLHFAHIAMFCISMSTDARQCRKKDAVLNYKRKLQGQFMDSGHTSSSPGQRSIGVRSMVDLAKSTMDRTPMAGLGDTACLARMRHFHAARP